MALDSSIVKKIADRHLGYSCLVIVLLTVISMLVLEYLGDKQYAAELKTCIAFSFVAGFIYNRSWKKVVLGEKFDVTKFYLIASGVRMLVAAFVVLIYCVVVREFQAILSFVIMFLAFYFIMLVFDSVYFARIEKGHKLKTKK